MERFRHVLVGLTRGQRDADLIRYAAMLARLDTAAELRFVHVLADRGAAPVPSHYEALEDIERAGDGFLSHRA